MAETETDMSADLANLRAKNARKAAKRARKTYTPIPSVLDTDGHLVPISETPSETEDETNNGDGGKEWLKQ
jgi:hypothetical protein